MDCEGIRVKPILALLPEGSNEIGVLSRLPIGLRTCRLEKTFLLAVASQFAARTSA